MDKTVAYSAEDAARDMKAVSGRFSETGWQQHDSTTAQPFCTVGARVDVEYMGGAASYGMAANDVIWSSVTRFRLVGGWKRHHAVPVQPVDTFGERVQIRTTDGRVFMQFADDDIQWGKVVAYRVVPPDEHIELTVAPLASIGTLRVEDGLPVQTPKVTAPDLLYKAAGLLAERGKQYDKPQGERSMAQTVDIFNRFHGLGLTEAQGWHFMQILKDVRLFQRPGYHADSAEDCSAYSALKAEAMAREAV